MATGKDHAEALRELVVYTEQTNRTVIEEIDAETDDNRNVNGYRIAHGNHIVEVHGVEDEDFFKVRYRFDILNMIANYLAQAEYEGTPEEGTDIEVTDEHGELAAEKLEQINKNKSDSELKQLQFTLTKELTSPNCAYQVHSALGGPRIIDVEKKMFVYEDKFTASDFDNAVQTVVSLGNFGKNILSRAYNVQALGLETDSTAESNRETKEASQSARMFQ